jgi:shikimate dehydrogenase
MPPQKRLPIIGSEAARTTAETVLRAALEAAGLTVAIDHLEPKPHQLADTIASLRRAGCLGAMVAAPYKERAAATLSALSDDARLSGAVNAIVRERSVLRGYNSDVDGIRAGLTAILPRVRGKWPKTAIVLGAGGGARAAVAVLIGSAFQRVVVFNRHLHRGEALVAYFGRSSRHMELRALPWHETFLEAELAKAGLLVNASGIGLEEGASPLVAVTPPTGLAVLDLVLHRSSTPLMRAAKAVGGSVANGQLSFLTAQGIAFRLWTGAEAPEDAMQLALAAAIGTAEGEAVVRDQGA